MNICMAWVKVQTCGKNTVAFYFNNKDNNFNPFIKYAIVGNFRRRKRIAHLLACAADVV